MPVVPEYPKEDWMNRLGRDNGSRQQFAQSSPLYREQRGVELESQRTGRRGQPADYAELDPFSETQLNEEEEVEFQKWRKKHAPGDSGVDYDLRGAFKEGLTPDERGHMSDKYKKPLHPTFSEESRFHGQAISPYNPQKNEGGRWEKNPDGSYNFYPGRTNLELHGAKGLIDYFKKYEKGNHLILPGQ